MRPVTDNKKSALFAWRPAKTMLCRIGLGRGGLLTPLPFRSEAVFTAMDDVDYS
jgi:hypothetical protein